MTEHRETEAVIPAASTSVLNNARDDVSIISLDDDDDEDQNAYQSNTEHQSDQFQVSTYSLTAGCVPVAWLCFFL